MIQLSFSAAQRYIDSPLSFFLHYYLRLRPVETGSALIFGSSVDAGLNSLLTDLRDGREPSVDRARLAFDTTFGAIPPEEIKYSKADHDMSVLSHEFLMQSSTNPAVPMPYFCLIAKGHMIIDAYIEQVLPKLEKVLLVQHEISLPNELGDNLIGVIDLVAQIEGKTYILDNKTSSIKYAENAVEVSQQLGTYYEALKDEYKLDGVGFIIIPKNVRKKKEPRIPIEIMLGNVDDGVIDETFQMYENVLSGIKSGKFECSRNCCKKPWPCSYKGFCDSGGKDLTGLKYEVKK
jgi:PD-(D/E)XK nuclease superfamily